MKRRLMSMAAAGLSASLVLAACGGDDGGEEGDGTTIKFLAAEYSSKTQPYWQNLIESFESENSDITVELEVVNWDQYDQRVKTLLQSQQQPDVLNHNKFADFARDGLLYKAEEIVSPEVLDDFLPIFVEQSQFEGDQYALPFISSARQFFWNKEIFQQAGLDPETPPANWQELRSFAEQITAAGAIGYGLPLGPEEAQAEFQMWINGNGGHYVDDSGNWAINSPENVETLQFLNGLVADGLTQGNPGAPDTGDRAAVFNLFAQGELGMMNGAVFLKSAFIDEQNPELQYGIASIPPNSGNESKTLGVVDYLMGFKKEGNQEAVKKFLDFFYQTENSVNFLEPEGFLPVTQSASDEMARDEYLKPFIEALPSAMFYPSTNPAWPAVDGAVKQTIATAVTDADPKQVLDQIQQTAEQESQG